MFQFSCRFVFYQLFVFRPDTENSAKFDAVSSKCANFYLRRSVQKTKF